MSKLNWTHDGDYEMYAIHNGYRIRAVRDDHPANPFENEDGNWPISVRLPDRHSSDFKDYADDVSHAIRDPLSRFTDAQLIHWQVHIAKVLGTSVDNILETHLGQPGEGVVKYCRDAALLRDALTDWVESGVESHALFDVCVALYKLIDIPAYTKQVTGYCQGDWAEVLVVAPPEVVEKFGATEVKPEDLEGTANLYGWWAYGDVYGYVIEKPIEVDEDGDVTEWEEIDSCWGYYGPDHDESGLAEAALECVPDEAPVMPVYEGERGGLDLKSRPPSL